METNHEEKKTNTGCLSTIVGVIIWAVIISLIVRACNKDSSDESSVTKTTNPPQITSSITNPATTVQVSPTASNGSLSHEQQVMEMVYFHDLYLENNFINVYKFSQRPQVLTLIADYIYGDHQLSGGYYLKWNNQLLGNDYFSITEGISDYYYFGKIKNNRPDGYGLILNLGYKASHSVDILYQAGHYRDGMLDGYGVEFDNNEYTAQYVELEFEEKSLSREQYATLLMYLENPVRYEGEFSKGKYDGKGNLFKVVGLNVDYSFLRQDVMDEYLFGIAGPLDVITCTWSNNTENGSGKLYTGGILRYDGELKNGKMTGKAKVYYEDGVIYYDGELKDGKRDGYGTSYDEYGNAVYTGQWKNDDYA